MSVIPGIFSPEGAGKNILFVPNRATRKGILTCDVPDYNGCQIQVDEIEMYQE
jgi:hypothetical protein